MAKIVTTLYIDDTSIRLLVCRGRRIRRWADLPLEPGLVDGAVITNKAEVAARIKQLIRDQKIMSKKVVVGLSGLLCLTRPISLPPLPKAMVAEAVIREAKRALPIPLEELYVSWQTLPSSGGKMRFFLTAVRRNSVDILLQTLQEAGLDPYLMDLKPLALARTVKEATTAVVDVQPTEFDIVIMANGVPHPIRTVPFPIETLPLSERLAIVTEELERTIKFYNSNNPEAALEADMPVYISGEALKPELGQTLSEILKRPVLLLSSPLPGPKEFEPSHYMVNIGLALKELSGTRREGALLVNLNTLPAAYLPEHFSVARVLILPVALVSVSVGVLLMTLITGTANTITSTRTQLDTINRLMSQKQAQKQELTTKITATEKAIAQAEASRNTFTTALDSLGKQDEQTNGDLKEAINKLPSYVVLTGIDHNNNMLSISGWAPSEAEVLSYAVGLNNTGRFTEVIFSSLQIREEDGLMDFTILLKVKE